MINFFVNWELWQQMTFVLAGAIVLVFIAGLIKLWWLSRFLKKHTILDLEKKARQQEMERSGLPVGRKIDIPFGVRAIQSGIEVDGIWISRPNTPLITPSSPSFASSSTLEPETRLKGKEKGIAVHTATTLVEVGPTPEQSPLPSPAISLSDRRPSTAAEQIHTRASPLGAQPTYRPKGPSRRRTDITETVDVNVMNQYEHNSARHQLVETYVPTHSFSSTESSSLSSQQKIMVDRTSISSDEGIRHAQTRYVSHLRHSALPTPRPIVSLEDPEPMTATVEYLSYSDQRRNPFDTPSSSSEAQPVSRPPLASNRPIPHRSYSGDSHANTSTRRVNAGFEVLPAGTFGRPDSQTETDEGQSRRQSNNKLQKKTRDRPSGETPSPT
ncbi:uncharacterized protein F4812DRAFT_459431 [Daldinia caldariorum]|uniref:uncharacterized protein n=1 Tax=Daldinia caldariorum TaxID=326644 RepID=UPI0020079A8F|nr:uncharacterized protein F4812DRAFT_459431 [Daldinia caldariorum]KAI1467325.1 hypothetical protein F4812DRAFT_459431 [Daldinia caldariorum]